MNIKDLQEFGLSNYEAKAFDALSQGSLSLEDLSKKSGIPFGKVYSVVKNLKEKGFVQETNSRPKLIFIENMSEVVSKMIRQRQEKEKQLNERLREFAVEIDNQKKKSSKFFELGIASDERKRIQLRMFNEADEEILQILNIYHNPEINRQSKLEYEKAHENAVKRGVKTRAIYPQKVILPRLLEKLCKKYPENFRVRRLNTDFARCDIVDGKRVLIKLTQKDVINSGGVIFIENEKFAENLKRIFENLWEQAE